MPGRPGHNQRPHLLGIDARMTSQLNIALIRKLRRSWMSLQYYFGMISMGICTTRHYQTPDRLVQVLNVCTVSCFRAMSDL